MAITPEAIAQFRTQAGLSPTPPSSSGPKPNDIIAQRKAALGITDTPQPQEVNDRDIIRNTTGDYFSKLGQEYSSLPSKISEDVKAGATDIQKGMTEGNDLSPSGVFNVAKGALKSAGRVSGDVAGAVYAPISTAVGMAFDKLGLTPDHFQSTLTRGSLIDQLTDIPWVQKLAMEHPNAGEDLGRALTLAMSAADSGKIDPKTIIERTRTQLGDLIKPDEVPVQQAMTATDPNNPMGKDLGVAEMAGKTKQAFVPELTPEEAAGKITQGETSDIPSSVRAIKDLDTEGVKSYKDLQVKVNDQIKTLSKDQDTLLGSDQTARKMQQFATEVDKGSGQFHNYLKDALDQLKDYYESTNDVSNLNKVNNYIQKLDPVKGEGITLKDANDIARMHGSDLNAYNANGELSSGLSKKAAENTRTGLKNTIREKTSSPTSKSIDAKISDLYTLKNLVDNMVEKVNKNSQKITKQGVVPKAVGKVVSKTVKVLDTVTGNPLKAIGREMGNIGTSDTLNPAELESNLIKYLKAVKNSK